MRTTMRAVTNCDCTIRVCAANNDNNGYPAFKLGNTTGGLQAATLLDYEVGPRYLIHISYIVTLS